MIMASIIINTGAQKGDYFLLGRQVTVIGRSKDVDIQVRDEHVSRSHVKIHFDKSTDGYVATDMGSKHGVLINGVRISDDTALNDGDCITIGTSVLLFTLEDFANRENAVAYLKQAGVWEQPVHLASAPAAPGGLDFDTWTNSRRRNNIQSFREWAGSDRMTLAIVFTDIVDSTLLAHELGNEGMAQVRLAHFKRARKLIDRLNGYEIKTVGDEFMVAFHTSIDALDFALELHGETGDPRVRIRVGINVGPVSVEKQDAHGTTVNYAARVMSMAEAGGVWLSNEAKNHVDQEKATRHGSLHWQKHPDCVLKGFPGQHQLWSVKKSG